MFYGAEAIASQAKRIVNTLTCYGLDIKSVVDLFAFSSDVISL